MKPTLLDAFCGAGGAAMGYHRAGFRVVGVDTAPQLRYPFEFCQSDALDFIRDYGTDFDVVHASPPCQRWSDLAKRNGNGSSHPDLIESTRAALKETGKSYVIENVDGAPLINPVWLCGTTFPALAVIRHRQFEANFPITPRPCGNRHPLVYTRDKRKRQYGMLDESMSYVMVNGGGNCSVSRAREAMGIDWMTKAELNEAVPPAYTEYVGLQLMKVLS
jgi:DNA (cytosine-5)-methyltransferase 1